MNKTKVISTLTGLAVVAGLVGSGTAAFAQDGDTQDKHQRPTPEMRQAWKDALENRDYQAWSELVVDRPISEKINEDNFDLFADAFALMKEGDKQGAKEIFDELGLERPKFGKHGKHFDPEKKEAIIQSLENNDYQAWLDAVGDSPVTEKINEENFGQLVEAHNLMKDGNKEGARAIFEELGIKRPGHRGGPHNGPKPDFQKSR